MEEILYNQRALRVQDRVLGTMPPFIDDSEQGSEDEMIFPGGSAERTLSYGLQQRAAQRVSTPQASQEQAGLVEHTTESPHNLDEKTIEAWAAWMVTRVVPRLDKKARLPQPRRETPDQAIEDSRNLLNDARKTV